jgi:hypothetical protein
MPGGMLSVSSLGTGNGIVWATVPTVAPCSDWEPIRGALRAYDAVSLTRLANTNILNPELGPDEPEGLGHWIPPTVIADETVGDMVIVATANKILAYTPAESPQDSGAVPNAPICAADTQASKHRADMDTCKSDLCSSSIVSIKSSYINEFVRRTLPAATFEKLKPADGGERTMVLEGSGVEAYGSDAARQRTVWRPLESSAQLHVVWARENMSERTVRVSVGPGPEWRASDGSRASVAIERSESSPAIGGAPWVLYRVTARSGQGVLGRARFVVRAGTQGGGQPPDGKSGVVPVAYAQYVLYE